jgi:hypothetical protein
VCCRSSGSHVLTAFLPNPNPAKGESTDYPVTADEAPKSGIVLALCGTVS